MLIYTLFTLFNDKGKYFLTGLFHCTQLHNYFLMSVRALIKLHDVVKKITMFACIATACGVFKGILNAESHLGHLNTVVESNLTVCDTTTVLSGTITKEVNWHPHILSIFLLFLFGVLCINSLREDEISFEVISLIGVSVIGICMLTVFMLPIRVKDRLFNVAVKPATDAKYRGVKYDCPSSMTAVWFIIKSATPSDICQTPDEYFKHCTYEKLEQLDYQSSVQFLHKCCASFNPGIDPIDDIYLDVGETLTTTCLIFLGFIAFMPLFTTIKIYNWTDGDESSVDISSENDNNDHEE